MGLCAFFSAAVVTASLATLMLAEAGRWNKSKLRLWLRQAPFSLSARVCFHAASPAVSRLFLILARCGGSAPLRKTYIAALQVYRFRYKALAFNVLISVGIVVLTAFIWFIVGRAVGIDSVSFFTYLMFNPIIAFFLLIPISFNGLGAKEAIVVTLFSFVGVPGDQALAMSLLFHVIVVVTSLPGGLVWFSKRRMAAINERGTTTNESTPSSTPVSQNPSR